MGMAKVRLIKGRLPQFPQMSFQCSIPLDLRVVDEIIQIVGLALTSEKVYLRVVVVDESVHSPGQFLPIKTVDYGIPASHYSTTVSLKYRLHRQRSRAFGSLRSLRAQRQEARELIRVLRP